MTARSPRRDVAARDSPRALIVWGVAVAALVVVLLAALFALRRVLLLVYVCVLLAIGLSPLVRWIERREPRAAGRRRVPRWLAILALYAAVLGVVSTLAAIVLPPLVAQTRDLVARGPALLEGAEQALGRVGIGRVSLDQLQQALPNASDAIGTVLGTVTGVLGGAIGLVTILILTFYLLVDADTLAAGVLRLFPHERRPQARAIAQGVTQKVSAWLTGQLILAAMIGASAGLALMLLGVPYFYVLAIVAAIGEWIPYVGPLVAGSIATAIGATVSWHLALAVAGYYLVQQLVEANLLIPKLMERQVGLSPVTILVAVLVGGELLGVMGVVLAVPTAAIIQATLQELGSSTD